MKIVFTSRTWDEYGYWIANDRDMLLRLNVLIDQCRRDPFRGIGKPEPLKNELRGWWSRRIDQEHRLVYRVEGKSAEQRLEIALCRFHYD